MIALRLRPHQGRTFRNGDNATVGPELFECRFGEQEFADDIRDTEGCTGRCRRITSGRAAGELAMQKVEGSSLFSRFRKACQRGKGRLAVRVTAE